jgi:hypothetical protein
MDGLCGFGVFCCFSDTFEGATRMHDKYVNLTTPSLRLGFFRKRGPAFASDRGARIRRGFAPLRSPLSRATPPFFETVFSGPI